MKPIGKGCVSLKTKIEMTTKYKQGQHGLMTCGVKARFEHKIERTETCWNWIGRKNQAGYGCFSVYQVPLAAHRFAWELYVGPIPYKKHVLHHCDNPACVRPEHLFIGDQAANNRDRATKGRNRPKHTYTRLTHCHRGHEYTPENTWIGHDGKRSIRHCCACRRERDRARAAVRGYWPRRKAK